MYFQIQQQKLSNQDRKIDTRIKIQLGGLIKKAGLDYFHPDQAEVLYGMLLDCKNKLDANPTLFNYWKELGKHLKS